MPSLEDQLSNDLVDETRRKRRLAGGQTDETDDSDIGGSTGPVTGPPSGEYDQYPTGGGATLPPPVPEGSGGDTAGVGIPNTGVAGGKDRGPVDMGGGQDYSNFQLNPGFLIGFDPGKLNDPNKMPGESGKYTDAAKLWGAVTQTVGASRGNMDQAIEIMRAKGFPNAKAVGDDKIDFGDGRGPIDVFRSDGQPVFQNTTGNAQYESDYASGVRGPMLGLGAGGAAPPIPQATTQNSGGGGITPPDPFAASGGGIYFPNTGQWVPKNNPAAISAAEAANGGPGLDGGVSTGGGEVDTGGGGGDPRWAIDELPQDYEEDNRNPDTGLLGAGAGGQSIQPLEATTPDGGDGNISPDDSFTVNAKDQLASQAADAQTLTTPTPPKTDLESLLTTMLTEQRSKRAADDALRAKVHGGIINQIDSASGPVDADSADLVAQRSAYGGDIDRGLARTREAMAARAAATGMPTGALDAGIQSSTDAASQSKASNNASLLATKYRDNLNTLQSALSQGAGVLSDEETRQLQAEIAATQSRLTKLGLDQSGQLGNRSLDVQSQLGNRSQDIQLLLGNKGLDIQKLLGLKGMELQKYLGDKGMELQKYLGDRGLDMQKYISDRGFDVQKMQLDLQSKGIDLQGRGLDLEDKRIDNQDRQFYDQLGIGVGDREAALNEALMAMLSGR